MLTVGYVDSLEKLRFSTPAPEWVKTDRNNHSAQLVARKENFFQMISQFFSKLFR